MDTFLLDTNLVSALYDSRHAKHAAAVAAVGALPSGAAQLVSVITIGEVRFGLALSRAAGQPLAHIETCLAKSESHPLAQVTRHTAEAFANVKSSIALARLDLRRRVPRWVEVWSDRVTGEKLQIDENDLWIAAQAIERNYVVLTSDQDFTRVIASAVADLRVQLV